MTLKKFIDKFMDGKINVDIFDSWFTDEETVHYTGRVEDLILSPEEYEELLNMYVESIDVSRGYSQTGLLLILVSKEKNNG